MDGWASLVPRTPRFGLVSSSTSSSRSCSWQRRRLAAPTPACRAAPRTEQAPAAADRLIQHFEIDLHRLAREITFEMQHALLLIERRRLGQLRRDDAYRGEVNALLI
jgi:hypothetical protein